QHLLVVGDLQIVGIDDGAVITERLRPGRLLVRRNERQPADLEQLRRREEHHLRWEAENRIDEHALLDDEVVEAALLRGNRRGESRGPRADDDEVSNRHPSILPFHRPGPAFGPKAAGPAARAAYPDRRRRWT